MNTLFIDTHADFIFLGIYKDNQLINKVEVFEKECLQSDIKIIDDLDIVSFEKIARIRLTITDPSRDYAKIHLERIFTCEDKYVLVINPDDRYWGEKGKKIYNNLIQHWKDKKKKIKRYNEKSPNDPNDWVSVHKRKDDHWNIAQLLESKNENYNFKSHLDKKRILINFTDPTTWAEWIIADLKRIEDCK